MSEIKELLNQSSHYFAGRIIIMAAGFISFPILTRIFSVSDYGTLGLINSTLFIGITISKFGLQDPIVRFYAEFKSKNLLTTFYSTLLLASVTFASAVAIIFGLVIKSFGSQFLGNNILNLLFLVSILMFIGCAIDILSSFLRAEQRTKLYNLIAIIRRYSSLSFSIFLVFFFVKGLYGFYVGQIVSGIMTLTFLVYICSKSRKISFANFSPTLCKDSIKFGFPLVWAELSLLLLNYADRYLIQFFSGSAHLGIYIAGYNLSMYVTDIIIYPIILAIAPIYMKLWVNKGEKKTKEFFTELFRYFLLIMFPVVFGFIAIGKDLLIFLASSKYIEAYTIFPYVVMGQLLFGCTTILNSGLLIKKKTYILTISMIGACLLNVGLNIMLIPPYGIIGAAQATLITYAVYTLIITYCSFKVFSFRIDYPNIFLYLTASLTMYVIIKNINLGSHAFNLITKAGTGIIVYSSLVILLDRDIRRKTVDLIKDLL